MRIDRLLCYLRFVKTRSQAQSLIDTGHVRCNSARILRTSQTVQPEDVLTIPLGKRVLVVQILSLPERRGSAAEARSHYQLLDPSP